MSIESNEPIKLFTSEFPTEGGLIFLFTFKGEHQRNDLDVYLNVANEEENRERQIVCTRAVEGNGNKIYPLSDTEVIPVNIYLANNGHTAVPSVINNWKTRFYILKFDKNNTIKDIGVRKIHTGRVLLGQMSLYSAKNFEHEVMEKSEIIKV